MEQDDTGGIRRFSSRRRRLDQSFLTPRLTGAKSYDRIAGYFSGSIFEVAGEALETVEGTVRVICNSGLQPADVATARAAAAALRQEWCASKPELIVQTGGAAAEKRVSRLYHFLKTRKMEIKVLPDQHFGLIHGKAGVITLADGTKTAFMGSANESRSAWRLNYELVWEDTSPDAVDWVQEEFDALWGHHAATKLADFIIEDIGRLSHREIIGIDDWRERSEARKPEPAAAFVEAPVYRQQAGLWEHQKYFVKLAFEAHLQNPGGARFVLADEVGLGKTMQLAMAAELMALVGDKPILILAPKTLLAQWQDEMAQLLDMPSALWNGRQWVDENEIPYPATGPDGIRNCPRRVGLVSTGLITANSECAAALKSLSYECVIVDEAHRARRKNLGDGRDGEPPDPNNLLRFLYDISRRTKSLLLATATPVQIRPVEAWDLLDALGRGSESVLGNTWSKWRDAEKALPLVTGSADLPADENEMWDWIRSPMPPRNEHPDFDILRRALDMADDETTADGNKWGRLTAPDRARLRRMFSRFIQMHNPFIRHIVRRGRRQLEEAIDPETREPFLKRIGVELLGDRDEDAIQLPLYLEDAYKLAEAFCRLIAKRKKGSGFLRTLLLRRVGSSMAAGRITAEKMLAGWAAVEAAAEEDDDGEDDSAVGVKTGDGPDLADDERLMLQRFVQALEANQERDPKFAAVLDCLRERHWLQRGCIVFSQYYDSAQWLASQLAKDFPEETIGVYAGSGKSGIWREGRFNRASREDIKALVRTGEMRLLLGTDAASEGLNLQRLGTLINLDLPWNPTRLEQRKGRIQRIGQINDVIHVYNMRYRGSVEDRVHQRLSARLSEIHAMFGQLPDVLEDVWIDVANGEADRAEQIINSVPRRHPFEIRYQRVEKTNWESCAKVLSSEEKRQVLSRGW